MSKIIIIRACGKYNKVSTDCFFRNMILNHTIHITDVHLEATKRLPQELENSFNVQEREEEVDSEAGAK